MSDNWCNSEPPTDDIVEELREAAKPDFLTKGSVWGQQEVRIALLSEAADEIERLRTAADELAEALRDARRRHQCDCVDGYDERVGAIALAEWEKVKSSGDSS